ncbi:hypothetical protein ACOSQ4_028261 [Xanthoceras sorbifolium]
MRGEWNGLQALFLKDCSSAYYIHCFAHRLQLALVAVAREVHDIWLFCSKLNSIVNFVSASSKRHSELKSIREDEIKDLIALGELKTATGANQICTLQRPGPTRWSSHFTSISILIQMFGSASTLLEKLINNGLNSNIRGEAKGAYKDLRSFEFVFILLLLHKILGISDMLCQVLQSKSQDILNAMNLVSTTKMLLLELRENGWNTFLESVVSFCDSPVDGFKSFNVDDICTLATKFYSQDFDKNDIEELRRQLGHYNSIAYKHSISPYQHHYSASRGHHHIARKSDKRDKILRSLMINVIFTFIEYISTQFHYQIIIHNVYTEITMFLCYSNPKNIRFKLLKFLGVKLSLYRKIFKFFYGALPLTPTS